MKKFKKMKKGAASFYVVIFATLILMVVVVSFAAIIATEMTKSSNDDLSQSAYDSAMAGIEDAKIAYYDYQNCLAKGSNAVEPNRDGAVDCSEVRWYMESNEDKYNEHNEGLSENLQINKCNMVSYILGRDNNEVIESNIPNNMQQEYTCVKIDDSLGDYRATLSSSDTTRVVRAKFDSVNASQIKKVKISWYTDAGIALNYKNFDSKVTFSSQAPIPPTISLALLQTSSNFELSEFKTTHGQRTNRGMIYLVPTEDSGKAGESLEGNYLGAYNGSENYIGKEGFLKSNDKRAQNYPYAVYCNPDNGEEFLCSTTVEIPEPVGGARNNDTFVFVVGLPYGKPVVDFSMEFYCNDGEACAKQNGLEIETAGGEGKNKANLKGVQINIDSTGRANDLYRRLETRLESSNDYSLSIFGPLELLEGLGMGGSATSFEKDLQVTSEYNY